MQDSSNLSKQNDQPSPNPELTDEQYKLVLDSFKRICDFMLKHRVESSTKTPK